MIAVVWTTIPCGTLIHRIFLGTCIIVVAGYLCRLSIISPSHRHCSNLPRLADPWLRVLVVLFTASLRSLSCHSGPLFTNTESYSFYTLAIPSSQSRYPHHFVVIRCVHFPWTFGAFILYIRSPSHCFLPFLARCRLSLSKPD